MLISTKGRYALRAVIDLAEHRAEGYIPLKEIAGRQDISETYLESILKTLVRAKLIVGLRGKGGGYKLNVEPRELSVYSILELAEGGLSAVDGAGEQEGDLSQVSQCKMREMWRELDRRIEEYLGGLTVADLMDEGNAADYYVI